MDYILRILFYYYISNIILFYAYFFLSDQYYIIYLIYQLEIKNCCVCLTWPSFKNVLLEGDCTLWRPLIGKLLITKYKLFVQIKIILLLLISMV